MYKKSLFLLFKLLFPQKKIIGIAIIFSLALIQSQAPLPPVFADEPSTSTLSPASTSQALITVDHNSIALFDQIPDSYIQAAANIDMLFIDRSVGSNINDGLTCLSYASDEIAPSHCKRYEHVAPEFSVDPSVVSWSHPGGYDRSNWDFLFWTPDPQHPEMPAIPSAIGDTNGNCSSWDQKTQCFIDYMEYGSPKTIDRYDVVSFQFSYLMVVPGATIADQPGGYFANNANLTDVFDQEAYEAQPQHSDKTFIYWTTSLARPTGSAESTAFNEQTRQYANEHNKVLFDVADILSHDPDGNPCYDSRDGVPYDNGNNSEDYADDGLNTLAICQHYTTEVDGGHLGSVSAGKIRVAKAFWVLMAQIAGWDPGTTTPTPPRVQSISPTNGATDVAVDAPMVINFSEAMNTASVTYSVSPNPGGITPTWNGSGTQLTLAHNDFSEGTDYTVSVTGGTDLDGNGLDNVPFNTSFTTIPPTIPRMQSVSPADGSAGVAVDAPIVINFSEAMNTGSVSYTLNPNPGGVTPAWNPGGTQLILNHSDFDYLTTYALTIVGGTDLDGNELENAPYASSFTSDGAHADLNITAQVNDIYAAPGDSVNVTLTIANAGPFFPVVATVVDQWASLEAVSSISNLPANCQASTNGTGQLTGSITCSNVNLTAGAPSVTYQFTMHTSASFSGPWYNQATVTANDTGIIDATDNNLGLFIMNPFQVFLPIILK